MLLATVLEVGGSAGIRLLCRLLGLATRLEQFIEVDCEGCGSQDVGHDAGTPTCGNSLGEGSVHASVSVVGCARRFRSR